MTAESGRESHTDPENPQVPFRRKHPSPNRLLQNVVSSLTQSLSFCGPTELVWLIGIPPGRRTFAKPTPHLSALAALAKQSCFQKKNHFHKFQRQISNKKMVQAASPPSSDSPQARAGHAHHQEGWSRG